MKASLLVLILGNFILLVHSYHSDQVKGENNNQIMAIPKILNPKIDSAAVIKAFNRDMVPVAKRVITDEPADSWLKEDLQHSLSEGSLYRELKSEETWVVGDINDDNRQDILVPYSIEGRGNGNNWDTHYAVFIAKEKGYKLAGTFARGGDMAEYITTFRQIKQDTIYGLNIPGSHFPDLEEKPVNYVFMKDSLRLLKVSH